MQSIYLLSCAEGRDVCAMSVGKANSSAWLWLQWHGVIRSGIILASVLMMRRVEPVMTVVGGPPVFGRGGARHGMPCLVWWSSGSGSSAGDASVHREPERLLFLSRRSVDI